MCNNSPQKILSERRLFRPPGASFHEYLVILINHKNMQQLCKSLHVGQLQHISPGYRYTYQFWTCKPSRPTCDRWECVSEGVLTVLKPLIHLSSVILRQYSEFLVVRVWHVQAVLANKCFLNPFPVFCLKYFFFFLSIFLLSYFSLLNIFLLCFKAINMDKLERSS